MKVTWTLDTTNPKANFDLTLKYTYLESFGVAIKEPYSFVYEFNSAAIAISTVKPVAPIV